MTEVNVIAIIGASAAGVSAAFTLRNNGYQGRVILIDEGKDLPYERPPLSKGLHHPAEQLHRPLHGEQAYRDSNIELRLGATALHLDDSAHSVVLDSGESIAVDKVLLAVGARPRTLDVPGSDLLNISTLRNLVDSGTLHRQLAHAGPTVVVGGGFIGLEAAASARILGGRVTIVEAGPTPLTATLGEAVGRRMADLHRAHGVEIRTSTTISRFLGSTAVEAVELSSGEVLPATTVIVGVGVEPNEELAAAAGVVCESGIVVDSHGRTSSPWIFAAGDVARQAHPALVLPGRIEHWDNAIKHGAATAMTMLGQGEVYDDLPYFWSDQYDATIQMYGRPAPGDEVVVREDEQSQGFLVLWTRGASISAALGMNRPRDLRAIKSLIERRIPVSLDDLTSPTVDFRQLARAAKQSNAHLRLEYS